MIFRLTGILALIIVCFHGMSFGQSCETGFYMDTELSLIGGGKSSDGIKIDFTANPDESEGEGEIIFRLQEPGEPIPVGVPGTRHSAIFEAGKSISTGYSFQADEPGHYVVYAIVLIERPGIRRVEETSIHLNVDAKGQATVIEAPMPPEESTFNGLRVGDIREATILPRSEIPQNTEKIESDKSIFGPFKVFGRIRFTDKLYTNGAFTGTKLQPVDNLQITLYDVEPGNNLELLGSARTNKDGRFTIQVFDNDDGPASQATRDLRFIIRCNSVDVRVMRLNSSTIHGVEYGDYNNWPGGNLSFTLDIDENLSGAFNIYHVMNKAVDFAKNKGENPPTMKVEWNNGVNIGTASSYSSIKDRIRILGDSSTDQDHFDDDVLLHEAGHFMMHKLSYDRSPGGSHSSGGLFDTRLAWSEGWATYFGGMVDYNRWYVDHTATDFSVTNLETNAFDSLGERNENSVAGALWDVYDGPDDGLDDLSDGSARSWSIFTSRIKSSDRAHYRDFYDGWIDANYPNLGRLQDINLDHGMPYDFAFVTYPSTASAEFVHGRTARIKWTGFPGTSVRIRLYNNNVFSRTITNSTNNDGAFNWRVPSSVTPGDRYSVLINDRTSPGFFDVSNKFFTVYPAPKKITVNSSSRAGNISNPFDEDWYYFVVTSKGNHRIETFQGSLKDTKMTLYGKNSRSKFLRFDDDSGPGFMSRINRYLYPGTYYVKVDGFGSQTGSYTVRVRK